MSLTKRWPLIYPPEYSPVSEKDSTLNQGTRSYRRRVASGVIAFSSLTSAEAHAQNIVDTSPLIVVTAESKSIHAQSQTAQLGPLGTTRIQDTPNAINVVPFALIEQQQLKSVQDTLRYIPSVQGDGARPQSRGFQGSVVQNSRIDGLNIASTTDYPAEQFERIEVLNGLSGAIYGPANPAGVFNYMLKRPTDAPLRYAQIGYGTDDLWLERADVSQRFGRDGFVGLRVNLLNEEGQSYNDTSHVHRQLASVALDFKLAPDTVLQTNYSYYRFTSIGFPGSFALAPGLGFPDHIDPTNPLYGQSYAGARNHTQTASGRLLHDFGGGWHLTVGVSDQTADRESTGVQNTITNAAGAYTSTIQTATASRFTILSNLAYLNGSFNTGAIGHAIAIGTNGFTWKNFNPVSARTFTLGSASLSNPAAFAAPVFPDFTNRYRSSRAWQQTLVVSDTITLTPQLSAVLTGSESWLTIKNSSLTVARTSGSSDSGFSPSISLLYKPIPQVTTYVTYASSLQQGDTAPVGTTNANEILAPFRSKQWEGGIKLGLPAIDLTLAVFDITRPFAFIDATSLAFAIDGEQHNRGIELMANGEILPGLAAYGGVTYLDPKLEDTGNALTSDKRIVGLSRFVASMLLTWQVPRVEGLSVNGFVRHASNRPTDNGNRFFAPGYTTLDLGVKEVLAIGRQTVALRLDVANVTNKYYLTNIVPGGLNGFTGAGNASAALARPRTVQASVGVAF